MKYYVPFLAISLFIIIVVFSLKENSPIAHCSEPPGFIGVSTGGGQLGNQMFDVAAGLAYAWDHNLIPVFVGFDGNENNVSQNRDKVFFRIDTKTQSTIPLKPYVVSNPGYVNLPPDLINVLLKGGFFSWKYFDHHRDKIIDLFAPSQTELEQLQQKYADLISSDKTVSIHVRTFSKKIHEAGCHFVGLDFFEEAMAQFPDDFIFVVFSDRMNWTKAKFTERFPGKKFVFIEGNDYIEDFYLMSLMKNHILSKSTFSWWAAYLNTFPEKTVYVPIIREKGIKGVLKPIGKRILTFFGKVFWWDENFWLPEWKNIYYNVSSYPEDIYHYGDETRSVCPLDR
ncbi:MAG: alpha-1,2-fucosyltransferase [Waddliaceae bacterium]